VLNHGDTTALSEVEVNDFGAVRSVFFRDPDGLEGEVLVAK
jgi:catechol 2,3-dioxygenase-like lactoylglutathione lyase family enzyme